MTNGENRYPERRWYSLVWDSGCLVCLFVCTCATSESTSVSKPWLLSEKKGVWGVFYIAAVIGTRLHAAVAIACVVMAFYVLFIK
ncbi:PREDICTED: protein kish-B [Rhinopithecus bieti]|uniref:protein kish-B n=1 Tax=Rhinopithecus bieti TaxID=61621 RepID=UPI00083C5AF9|nr:PREDICTED: protein kish-B [Rhinopithecus bieti]